MMVNATNSVSQYTSVRNEAVLDIPLMTKKHRYKSYNRNFCDIKLLKVDGHLQLARIPKCTPVCELVIIFRQICGIVCLVSPGSFD